jgi:aryl-alcohol dehydrogenase-like predicted oxidoreductase
MTETTASTDRSMPYGQIPGIQKPVARVIQGSTMIGGDLNEAQSFALLDAAFELGCNTLDTAHVYCEGESERVIGRWLRARRVRDQMVIITKGAHHNDDRRRLQPFDVTCDLYDSLARLQTDSVDLYLLHRDDLAAPVEPLIDVLNEHRQAGRIRAFGCSNWSVERLQAANAYARSNGLAPFVASSPQYSLAEQVDEPWPNCITISGAAGEAVRDWYAREGMAVLAWSPLAGGFFSGRFRRDNLSTFEKELDRVCIRAYASEDNFKRLDRARILAEERGRTLAQVALAYVMAQPLNVFTVVGPSKGERFKANVEASTLRLSPQELAWLDLKSDSR